MGVIFFFSTDLFSGPQTSRVIGPFLKWFMPDVSDETIRDIRLVIRKAAHVLEYAILSILSCRALAKHTTPLPWAVLGQAVLIASVYAVLDEWHQSWTAERFGSLLDVGIDCSSLGIDSTWVCETNWALPKPAFPGRNCPGL